MKELGMDIGAVSKGVIDYARIVAATGTGLRKPGPACTRRPQNFVQGLRWLLALFACLLSSLAISAPAFEDNLAQRLLACTSCHGAQGRAGPDGYYPRLAGKPAAYLYQQLLNIREGRRHYALMSGLLASLPADYLMDIARYFSALDLPYPVPAPSKADAATLARGKQLALVGDADRKVPACAQCHGTALTGVEPATPGLLGLPRDYLNAQLGGWQTGQRRALAPDCMASVARRLTASDINAVAHWLAAQPVPAKASAAPQPAAPSRAMPSALTSDGQWVCANTPALGPSHNPPAPVSAMVPIQDDPSRHGAYLARLGNCMGCHTSAEGQAYAGGRPIETPFGRVFSSNITPDPVQGLGQWSPNDFWRAMREGRSRDGHALYPAFPYASYSGMTRADSDSLFAYLKTLPHSQRANSPHDLRWPYRQPWALALWRAMFFKPLDLAADASHPPDWNRGAYLVRSLGHCGECHTPRNLLGASRTGRDLEGATLPGSAWYAPSLRSVHEAGTHGRPPEELSQLLSTGRSARAWVSGPMTEVVQGSTQHLSPPDLRAMVTYLDSLSGTPSKDPTSSAMLTRQQPASGGVGARLYERHCVRCHGDRGEGIASAYPPLAGTRAVKLGNSVNLIQIVLHGGFGPATSAQPRPFGMPPFLLELTDSEVAAVLTHVRQSWGNAAPQITELDVRRARKQP